MTIRYTSKEARAHVDETIMQAKEELRQEILMHKRFSHTDTDTYA